MIDYRTEFQIEKDRDDILMMKEYALMVHLSNEPFSKISRKLCRKYNINQASYQRRIKSTADRIHLLAKWYPNEVNQIINALPLITEGVITKVDIKPFDPYNQFS